MNKLLVCRGRKTPGDTSLNPCAGLWGDPGRENWRLDKTDSLTAEPSFTRWCNENEDLSPERTGRTKASMEHLEGTDLLHVKA